MDAVTKWLSLGSPGPPFGNPGHFSHVFWGWSLGRYVRVELKSGRSLVGQSSAKGSLVFLRFGRSGALLVPKLAESSQLCTLQPPPPFMPRPCLWRGHSVNQYRPLIPQDACYPGISIPL